MTWTQDGDSLHLPPYEIARTLVIGTGERRYALYCDLALIAVRLSAEDCKDAAAEHDGGAVVMAHFADGGVVGNGDVTRCLNGAQCPN